MLARGGSSRKQRTAPCSSCRALRAHRLLSPVAKLLGAWFPAAPRPHTTILPTSSPCTRSDTSLSGSAPDNHHLRESHHQSSGGCEGCSSAMLLQPPASLNIRRGLLSCGLNECQCRFCARSKQLLALRRAQPTAATLCNFFMDVLSYILSMCCLHCCMAFCFSSSQAGGRVLHSGVCMHTSTSGQLCDLDAHVCDCIECCIRGMQTSVVSAR